MQLLPSKDEALAIRSYLPESAVDRDSAISKLGEVEKYMAYMLEVNNAHGKLKSMIYRVQFNTLVEALEEDTESLREAVACVRKSDRLARLMLFVLRLGNTLNTGGGSGKDVAAITLDSLLKLQEVRFFHLPCRASSPSGTLLCYENLYPIGFRQKHLTIRRVSCIIW
jgi:hypothetical protein